MKNLKHSKSIWPVKTPFMVAYRDKLTGTLDLQPYVDLHWKIKIWGIAFNGMVFKLTHEPGADWQTALSYTDNSQGCMPTTAELEAAYANKEGFDEIIDFLKENGVKAENWQSGWYWSKEEKGDNAVVMDMDCGQTEMIQKRIKNGYTRLVSRKIGSNKNINVQYGIAYLHDGQFETSSTLYLNRLNEIWGIQIGNGYFRLTDEPQKMIWADGMALAKNLCTDKITYSLPTKEVFEEVVKYRDDVNDALVKLEAYGIHTDLWNDKGFKYLTSSETGEYFATYMYEVIPKNMPCTCRLYAKNKGGMIVI